MEHWDIYNADRIPTGKTIERDTPLQKGEYHLVVHVCIFNSDGELLIQKRQPWKSQAGPVCGMSPSAAEL